MTTYLIDNSVLARASLLIDRLDALAATGNLLCICGPTLDEAMFSARSSGEALAIQQNLLQYFHFLGMPVAVDSVAREIRTALFAAGLGRAAGVVGVLISAIAVAREVTVLHYDSDFQHIAAVYPRARTVWVAEAGTLSH